MFDRTLLLSLSFFLILTQSIMANWDKSYITVNNDTDYEICISGIQEENKTSNSHSVIQLEPKEICPIPPGMQGAKAEWSASAPREQFKAHIKFKRPGHSEYSKPLEFELRRADSALQALSHSFNEHNFTIVVTTMNERKDQSIPLFDTGSRPVADFKISVTQDPPPVKKTDIIVIK